MKYYLMDTTEGIKYIKTKKTIRGREQAREVAGCGVCSLPRIVFFVFMFVG